MKPLLLVFKAGLGGPVGPGEQYFSTISLPDWVRAATYLATNDEARGVYNVSAPERDDQRASSAGTSPGCCTGPRRCPVPAFADHAAWSGRSPPSC